MLKNLNRIDRLVLIGISALFFIIYMFLFDRKADMGGDNAFYYILGNALAQGKGFVMLSSESLSPNNHFPPGYPAILSIFIFLFSDSIIFLKVINGLFLLGAIYLTYFVTRKFSKSVVVPILVAAFMLFNVHLLRYGTIMMSEVPYTFFLMLTLLLFSASKYKYNPVTDWMFWLILFLLVATIYIRTTGIALAFAVWVFLGAQKKWKYLGAYFVGTIVLLLPWQIRSANLGGSSYIRDLFMVNPYRPEMGKAGFSDFLTRFWENFTRYVTNEIPDALFPFYNVNYQEVDFSMWLWGIIIFAIGVLGLVRMGKTGLFLTIYMVATMGILLLWPSVWIGNRFITPSIPVLLIAFFEGAAFIFSKAGELIRKKPFTPAFLFILLLGYKSPIEEAYNMSNMDYPPNVKNYFTTANWIKRNDPEAVVSCRKPALFYLYSKSYTTRYKYTNDDQDLINDLQLRKADYVVIDQLGYSSTARYLFPAVQKNMNRFQVVQHYQNPDTYLLKFNP